MIRVRLNWHCGCSTCCRELIICLCRVSCSRLCLAILAHQFPYAKYTEHSKYDTDNTQSYTLLTDTHDNHSYAPKQRCLSNFDGEQVNVY